MGAGRRKVHDHPLKPNRIPYALRIHGSVIPRVWKQVAVIGIFSIVITCVSELTNGFNMGIQTTMISTLGFIVGLALSFRTSTAYNNWLNARSQFDRLTSATRNLARIVWIHGPDDGGTADLLAKKSVLNLLAAFGVSLKHHLREERGHDAPDVVELVKHLNTYSRLRSNFQQNVTPESPAHALFSPEKGDLTSNHTVAYGCLPVEITFHIASYMEYLKTDRNLDAQTYGHALAQTNILIEITSICERILRDPIPVAYNIVISQLVWVFMLFLPFQLQLTLHWLSIPATIITGAMLFGLAEIGLEIADPFGEDVNDLDTDRLAQNVALELDTLSSQRPVSFHDWVADEKNTPLYPSTHLHFHQLMELPREDLQTMMRNKALEVRHYDVLEARRGTTIFKPASYKQVSSSSSIDHGDLHIPVKQRSATKSVSSVTSAGRIKIVHELTSTSPIENPDDAV